MSDHKNEFMATAAAVVGRPNGSLNDKDISVALVAAVLALAGEVAALREVLEDGMAPHGAIAGFLDEIAVRLAPAGDSISEAIVSASGRGGEEL